MPIYEYQCQDCSHQYEALVFASDESDPPCAKCQSLHVVKLMSAGCILNSSTGPTSDIGASAASGCRPVGGG